MMDLQGDTSRKDANRGSDLMVKLLRQHIPYSVLFIIIIGFNIISLFVQIPPDKLYVLLVFVFPAMTAYSIIATLVRFININTMKRRLMK